MNRQDAKTPKKPIEPAPSVASWRLRGSISSWTGPVIVAVVFLAMTFVIWNRGPDPVLDFGREVYIPWRIDSGQVLYRDIEYFNGPFSPYFNAVVFKLFGTSLEAITTVNLLILIAATVLLYGLLLRAADHVGAAAGCCAFLICCALAHRTGIANFNFITPYSHELPHGLVLSLALIACLYRFQPALRRTDFSPPVPPAEPRDTGGLKSARRGCVAWIATAGFLLGLIFLTKAEVFLAASVTAIVGLALSLWIARARPKQTLSTMAIFVAFAVLPVLIAFLLLAHASNTATAFHGLAGSWPWVGDQRLMQLPYFRSLLGTDNIPQNLLTLAVWSLAYAVVIAIAWGINRLEPKRALVASTIVAIVMCVFVVAAAPWIRWQNFLRPLPLVLLVAFVWLMRSLWRCQSELPVRRVILLRVLLTLLGGLMLAKMALNVSLIHYGFALAMPGLVVFVVAMVSWLPRVVGTPMRFLGLALLVPMLAVHAHLTWQNSQQMIVPVGTGGDTFFADGRGGALDVLLQDLQSVAPDKTLTMMPEGLIANYLSRRVNPSRYAQFTPPNLIMYGEDKMLASLKDHPPDYIGLVHIKNVEYAAPFFGKDYALDIAAWVRQNYHEVHLIGQMPFEEGTSFGIRLMQKND